MKPLLLLLAALPLVASAGCQTDKLETGYAYTPLGDSSSKRRSYYADPFSPEAKAAQAETQNATMGRGQIPGQ